jgi:hypothetical protein
MADKLKNFDHAGLYVNQGTIIALLVLAFIINLPWLVYVPALATFIGTVFGFPGFGFLYTAVLKPLGWVKSNIYADNNEPHRFAQGFGSLVLLGSLLAFWLGNTLTGWILAWVVIILASLNLFAGFCAGCAVYYWLNQLKVPGFSKPAPDGSFPGLRPRP